MKIWLFTLAFMTISLLAMAIGVLLGGQKKKIAGSCGGINKLMGNPNKECDFCGLKDLCEDEKEFLKRVKYKKLDPLI